MSSTATVKDIKKVLQQLEVDIHRLIIKAQTECGLSIGIDVENESYLIDNGERFTTFRVKARAEVMP